MKVRVKETNDIIDVWIESPGIYRPKDITYKSEFGPVYFEEEDLDFNPYNDVNVDIINDIISELNHLKYEFINQKNVTIDDTAIITKSITDKMIYIKNNLLNE